MVRAQTRKRTRDVELCEILKYFAARREFQNEEMEVMIDLGRASRTEEEYKAEVVTSN